MPGLLQVGHGDCARRTARDVTRGEAERVSQRLGGNKTGNITNGPTVPRHLASLHPPALVSTPLHPASFFLSLSFLRP